ncbi:50S ribosomal protein L5, partial [Enterococcus faecium]|uniref:50S ribosomal protein L5 n=1 Tax=Enterococcus faecium TaxID=1352 RepID=UPI003CC63852
MNRLKEENLKEVTASVMEKFNYSSVMQTPKVEKFVINMGVGDAVSNGKNLDKAVVELTLITGQKPMFSKAIKS